MVPDSQVMHSGPIKQVCYCLAFSVARQAEIGNLIAGSIVLQLCSEVVALLTGTCELG